MALKTYKAITPSLRGTILIDRKGLYKGHPLKILTCPLVKQAGRNNIGQITVRRQGGGHKKAYRLIDLKRNKYDVVGTVERIEYDPNRTSFIALIKYADGIFSYILAPQKLEIGDKVLASKNLVDVKVGNAMPLAVIPIGSLIHNIEIQPGQGGRVARSAGSYAQLVGKNEGYALLKLQSGEIKLFLLECMATIGVLSNLDHKNIVIGKAGRNRWLGRRPNVRGDAMNPVDHPHGGRTHKGKHPKTPTGKCAKGGRTRNRQNKTNRLIVRSRHKNKKG
jgi:large subunit ribosomal protein L2